MVSFKKFTLSTRSLEIIHEGISTRRAAMNILCIEGARDEREDKIGFAHVFEYLMFRDLENAHQFDEPLTILLTTPSMLI